MLEQGEVSFMAVKCASEFHSTVNQIQHQALHFEGSRISMVKPLIYSSMSSVSFFCSLHDFVFCMIIIKMSIFRQLISSKYHVRFIRMLLVSMS